jgi:nucleolar protein 14
LQYQSLSKRFIPEVLNFINLSLYILAPQEIKRDLAISFPLPEYVRNLELHITEAKKTSPQPLSVSGFLTDNLGRAEVDADQARISLLVGIVKVLEAYMQLYGSTAAFIEAFEPSLALVQAINGSATKWNSAVKVCDIIVIECIVLFVGRITYTFIFLDFAQPHLRSS